MSPRIRIELAGLVLGSLMIACPQAMAQDSRLDNPRDAAISNQLPLVLQDRIVEGPLQFAGFDSAGDFVFEPPTRMPGVDVAGSDFQNVRPSDHVWWGGQRCQVDRGLIRLSGGSIIVGHLEAITHDRVGLSSSVWQPFELPRNSIRSILFNLPENSSQRDKLLDLFLRSFSQDRVWMDQEEFVEGTVTGIDSERRLVVDSSAGTLRLPMEQVVAISFQTIDEASTPDRVSPRFEFSLTDGSSLLVSEISFDENSAHAVCNGINLVFRLRTAEPPMESTSQLVCGIRNLVADVDYLGRLEPFEFQHHPLTGSSTVYQIDRSVTGARIRMEETCIPFGIGMPSRSSLVFRLSKPASALQFGVIMDGSSREGGSVICKVLKLNANNEWQTAWTSSIIRGGDPVSFHQVPLAGAAAVALTVSYADGADVLDRLNWVMPRLIR